MSEITVKNKNGIVAVTNEIAFPETINQSELMSLHEHRVAGLFDLEITHKRKTVLLTCAIQGMYSLKDFLCDTINKKTFLLCISQIKEIIKEAERNSLNINNLDLRPERMYINPVNGRISVIYWPVVNNKIAEPFYTFFKNLRGYIKIDQAENIDYYSRFISFFNDASSYSFKEFERFLDELMGRKKEAENRYFDNTSSISEDGTKKRNSNIEYDPSKNNLEYDPFKESRGLGYLIRVSNGEIISIDKKSFIIGSDNDRCDYTVKDNPFISHIHCAVGTEGGVFYIYDFDSKNSTYVNGTLIPPNKKIMLKSGMKVRLANEEFVFQTQVNNR